MDPFLSFHKQCNYVTDRNDKRNNMLKALAASSWEQEKGTLQLTYNTLGKSITSYDAQVWSAALRTATGAHKMVSINHLQQESLSLKVNHHHDSDMLPAQYIVNCL